jgi:hypothetical protein
MKNNVSTAVSATPPRSEHMDMEVLSVMEKNKLEETIYEHNVSKVKSAISEIFKDAKIEAEIIDGNYDDDCIDFLDKYDLGNVEAHVKLSEDYQGLTRIYYYDDVNRQSNQDWIINISDLFLCETDSNDDLDVIRNLLIEKIALSNKEINALDINEMIEEGFKIFAFENLSEFARKKEEEQVDNNNYEYSIHIGRFSEAIENYFKNADIDDVNDAAGDYDKIKSDIIEQAYTDFEYNYITDSFGDFQTDINEIIVEVIDKKIKSLSLENYSEKNVDAEVKA